MVEISRLFTRVFFRQKCLLDQRKHTRSSTKISMEKPWMAESTEIFQSCLIQTVLV
jgi:hypothetical protein